MELLLNLIQSSPLKIEFGQIFSSLSPFAFYIIILFIMIMLDTLFGLLYSLRIKKYSTKKFRRCLFKIVTYFTAVAVIRLVEEGIAGIVSTTLPTHIIVSFLIITEAISVLKNLALLGVPIPMGFVRIITGYIKSNILKDLIMESTEKQEYINEINDLIIYQIPTIKSDNLKMLLKIKFEEWSKALDNVDAALTSAAQNNPDLIYLRLQSLINAVNYSISEKWRDAGIPGACIDSFTKWRSARTERWLYSIKEACYSADSIENKRKQIIEKFVIMLYQTIIDIQKGEFIQCGNNSCCSGK